MSGHRALQDMAQASNQTLDPGDGKVIVIDRFNQVIGLVIAASATETNTIAAPLRAGLRCIITAYSVGSGGTRAITAPAAANQTANTTMTFGAVRDTIVLESIPLAAAATGFAWHIVGNDGVSLS